MAQDINVKFIAQSGFLLSINGKNMVFDPWITNSISPMSVNELGDVDFVFLTHDHSDHGPEDAVKICKSTESWFVSPYDLALSVKEQYGLDKIVSANVGGFFDVDGVEIKYVNATHTSGVGLPVGYMIRYGGLTTYHMGDTGYQSDFKKLGELYPVDLLFVPIGSRYTMDPYEASFAVDDLKPKYVIPMHYNTFPKIEQDPTEFKKMVSDKTPESEVIILEPGEETVLSYSHRVA